MDAEAGMGTAAGNHADHLPVMLEEVMGALAPIRGETHMDATFGAGGYSQAILTTGAKLLALDRDPSVAETAESLSAKFPDQFSFRQEEFGQLDAEAQAAGILCLDGVVLDVGVSSMQLDQAERGFSFMRDGPLDMRMANTGLSAADLVNHADGKDITRIIGILGEEKQASRISRAIVSQREIQPICTTLQLSKLVEKTIGHNPKSRIHPATRTFQALRIFVNQELRQLAAALFASERILSAGGRLVVVTFHSLEDRIVKRFFADRANSKSGSRHLPQTHERAALFTQNSRRAQTAGPGEIELNPRARSAKLRWAIRTDEPAAPENFDLFGREVNLALSRKIQI